MHCKHCGQRLLDTATRCPSCKNTIEEADRLAAREQGEDRPSFTGWGSPKREKSRETTGYGRFGAQSEGWDSGQSWKRGSQRGASYERENAGEWQRSEDYQPPARDNSSFAVASMVIGILNLILSFLYPSAAIGMSLAGIVAAVLGFSSRKRYHAVAGLVLCIIALLLAICCQIMITALMGNVDWTALLAELS